MKFKGTKGKWEVEKSFDNKYKQDIFNISSEGIEGLAVCYSGGKHFIEEQRYNAQLISCAPEMLEMLEKVCAKLKGNGFPSLQKEVEQLIKKATEI